MSRHCGRPAPNARAERGLHPFRSATHRVADTNDRWITWAAEANQISAADTPVGSRSAFIVPVRAGNQAHWDPKEGREASC